MLISILPKKFIDTWSLFFSFHMRLNVTRSNYIPTLSLKSTVLYCHLFKRMMHYWPFPVRLIIILSFWILVSYVYSSVTFSATWFPLTVPLLPTFPNTWSDLSYLPEACNILAVPGLVQTNPLMKHSLLWEVLLVGCRRVILYSLTQLKEVSQFRGPAREFFCRYKGGQERWVEARILCIDCDCLE